MASMRDVAERCGVSIATVSRALAGTGPVSEEVSRRIQQAVDGNRLALPGRPDRGKVLILPPLDHVRVEIIPPDFRCGFVRRALPYRRRPPPVRHYSPRTGPSDAREDICCANCIAPAMSSGVIPARNSPNDGAPSDAPADSP